MKVLKNFEFPARANGKAAAYPWDTLCNGQKWELVQAEDFPGTNAKWFIARARVVGRKRGLRLKSTVLSAEQGRIAIQFVPKNVAPETAVEPETQVVPPAAPAKKGK